jgi:hypothetical protein
LVLVPVLALYGSQMDRGIGGRRNAFKERFSCCRRAFCGVVVLPVAALGKTFTFYYQVSCHRTIPSLVQTLLKRRRPFAAKEKDTMLHVDARLHSLYVLMRFASRIKKK